MLGKSFFDLLDFTPATPKAVMTLLDYYDLGNVRGKQVAVIGQSTIVGKPLALELLKRGAFVATFDIRNTPEEIRAFCQKSDYILRSSESPLQKQQPHQRSENLDPSRFLSTAFLHD